MADSFFGFDTSLGAGLDERLDCLDDEDFGENYDALNDETFGSEAVAGDWEEDHEKLAQITESNRSRLKNDSSKSESEIDVEKSLAHLVLDEKVTIPRPGVWDSPNFSLTPIPVLPKPSLSATLKNACTVEELERGLISSRPPPGLTKPLVSHPPNSAQSLLLNSISPSEKLPQINGVGPSSSGNQFPLVLPPNVGIRHAPIINVGQQFNQSGNLLRSFGLPPHLLMQTTNQRQPPPFPGNFSLNIPHADPRIFPFMRPGHPSMPPHNNHHQPMGHHNVHGGNQRNQNNKFNHDRQDNHHQPFFRNNQYHHQNLNNMRYHNQGYHGHQHMNHHHHSSSNGIGLSGEQDEYAGLMNHREKQWLHSIQLLQLNTNQPYIDDYYYTVFCDRVNKKNELQNHCKLNNNNNNRDNNKRSDNMKGGRITNNNNNSNGYRESRDREQQPSLAKATTPMQFENSLGKLQYSSVTAPRKIIDMDVVPSNEPQQTPTVQQKDMKKTRQLLLEIERMYLLLLKLEDKTNPLAILADQQREQQLKEQQQQAQQEGAEPVPEPEKKDPVKEKEELTSSIMTSILQFVQDDKLASVFSIRKGKMMFLRLLPCIDVKEQELKLNKVWVGIIKGLSIISRRDSQLLLNFFHEFLKCINVTLLVNLTKEFIESAKQPSKSNILATALSNKFGLSVISAMLKFADELSNLELNGEQWLEFLRAIIDCALVSLSPPVAPWDFLNTENLRSHLKRHGIESQAHVTLFELYFTEVNPAR